MPHHSISSFNDHCSDGTVTQNRDYSKIDRAREFVRQTSDGNRSSAINKRLVIAPEPKGIRITST
jgi:hypothetical protein